MVNMLLGLAKYSNLSGLHPTAPKTLMKSKKKNNQNQKIYEKINIVLKKTYKKSFQLERI